MMTEEEFRSSLIEKYRVDFDHCYRLHQFVQATLQNNKWFTKNHYDAALLYIRPRSFKAFDAVRRLCEVALCEDAAVVLRCLVNLMAVTRWISLIPDKRAKKYLAWYWIERHERVARRPDRFSAEQIAVVQKHFDTEKSQFEFTNSKGKLVLARNWYQPEVNNIFEMFKEVGLEQVYENSYRPLSATEHSDVMAYFAMFAKAEMIDGETKLEIQSDANVSVFLRTAFHCFADILAVCDKAVPLSDGKELSEIIAAGLAYYKNDAQVDKI
jgi:Family of unknown function (DUF5677)